MMRSSSRIAMRSIAVSVAPCTVVAAVATPQRFFASKYGDDVGARYNRSYTTNSRSGAHRHPPRKEILREQRAAAAAAAKPATTTTIDLHRDEELEDEEAHAAPPSSPKNHYPEYYRKKADERLLFTSNFREPDVKPILDAAHKKASAPSRSTVGNAPTTAVAAAADMDDDDTDVTRIYSKEEMRDITEEGDGKPGEVMKASHDDVLDALSADEVDECAAAAAPAPTAASKVHKAEVLNTTNAVEDEGEDADEFAEIRSHPFFMDMLRRVERNMIRFRKETRTLGRYSLEAVDECVRPLLQLTDYPLTATQLSHLSHSISPAVLKSSLRDRSACRRLQLYRSQDTDLLLDWSVEDFLRRRYESVHLSWEPVDVICRRFGWTADMLTDRDYLLYFSAFSEYVELAELKAAGEGAEPKATPIADPAALVAGTTIPASRLLLRRKAAADAEPSLTESIRLMGNAAVEAPAKGKKAQRMRQHGGDSVSDYFHAVEASANAVDGREAVRLQHAAETVPPLRQASHPGGRTVREFSIPKSHAVPSTKAAPAAAAVAPPVPADAEEGTFDQRRFEEVSNAYHNTKVENSLLRRRMLATDNVDKAQEMQAKLASGRREAHRLEQELERMRELKRSATGASTAAAGFQVPRGLPRYQEAPETAAPMISKNESAVEDIDDDEIDQALREFKEEEQLAMEGKLVPHHAAPATTSVTVTTATTVPVSAAKLNAAAGEDEYEEVEVEVEEEDGDLTAAEDLAVTERVDAETDIPDAMRVRAVEAEPVQATTSTAAAAPTAPSASVKHADQEWQDELEAAVEQQEAEREEDEDFSTVLHDTSAATPALRLEQLTSLFDRVSSAADRARRYVATVEARRQEVLEKVDCQLADANKKVGLLEEQLAAVEEEQATLHDTMAREEAEKKAREAEAQLKLQREKRMAQLAQERERARLAQEEAAKALERQKMAEQEALAMEEELQRKLRDVQSRLRNLKSGEEPPQPLPATAPSPPAKRAKAVPAAAPAEAKSEEKTYNAVAPAAEELEVEEDVPSTPVPAGQFMCTPEQYDGLHLAADRLKKEIGALEVQMEEEGDEDDETLMAVLAASRADLEELEECIASVRANAAWAAARDARREKEYKLSAQVADTEAHHLQSAIDNHRFQISLLEKRMQHTSQKSVLSKLKDRVGRARRAISQLRHEQDTLRRAGRDALGLPASVSIAETLAHEGKESEEAKSTEEEEARAEAGEDEAEKTEEVATQENASVEAEGALGEEEAEVEHVAVEAVPAPVPGSDADKLRLRLDSMVEDIQHLQDSIKMQERSSDYDDEETEGVLREMKEKLSQLLRLRDQVQRALVEESVKGPATMRGAAKEPTPVIRSAAEASAPAVGRAVPAVHNGPSAASSAPHSQAQASRVSSASKKIRGASRSNFASQRRR